MIDKRHPLNPALFALAVVVVPTLLPQPAAAAEIGVFISGAQPSSFWGTGFGGFVGISLFNVLGLELEGAWQGGEVVDSSMFSLSGRAYLAPTFGRFAPYAGLSTGGYRQTLGSTDEWGRRSSVFVGAKLKFPLIVLRAEYEWVDVSSEALIPFDNRFYGGVGISF
jgi:Outer membrane protein beta-barrel domain